MKPTTACPRSRLDPEPVARRDFLGIASLGSFLAAVAFAGLGMLRLPKAAVLASPSKKFSVAIPESLPAGEPFVPPGRSVAVFRDEEGVYAISLICTHLGCIVKPAQGGFECPCHGSQFAADGSVLRGPAPKALPWHPVTMRGSECMVDQSATIPAGTKVSA